MALLTQASSRDLEDHRDLVREGDRRARLDRLLVAGEASSHCVKNTLEDLLRWIGDRDPALARKVYVLEDCMSAVAVRDPARPGELLADFTDSARTTLDRCRDAGMRVVRSTVPMEEWPLPGSTGHS